MDPLAVGIFNVASSSPLESVLFFIGGMMTIIGIGYAAIIGIAGDKHKTIGIAIMFLGSGVAAYPTLSMMEALLGGGAHLYVIGGVDIKPFIGIGMILGAVMMLRSAFKTDVSASTETPC